MVGLLADGAQSAMPWPGVAEPTTTNVLQYALLSRQHVQQADCRGVPAVVAAQSICVAHAIANNNTLNIAFVTHNDFQDPYAPYPASHGLIPLTSGPYLNATSGSNIAATHQVLDWPLFAF